MLWIKEVEMVDSLERIEVFAISLWTGFSKLRDSGREDCLCSEQDPLQEEGKSRGAESPRRGPVSTRKIDLLHDLRPFSSDWRSWYSIGLCWFFCYSSWWQHSGIRYKMGRIFSILESLYKLRKRESDQLKTVLELYDMEIQKTSVFNYQKLKTMVKRSINQKLRLRNVDSGHGRSESGAVVKRRKGLIGVEGGKGICYQWTEKRPVFARRPMQFPPRNPRSCAKTRRHCRHTFWTNRITTSKCVEEEKYPKRR